MPSALDSVHLTINPKNTPRFRHLQTPLHLTSIWPYVIYQTTTNDNHNHHHRSTVTYFTNTQLPSSHCKSHTIKPPNCYATQFTFDIVHSQTALPPSTPTSHFKYHSQLLYQNNCFSTHFIIQLHHPLTSAQSYTHVTAYISTPHISTSLLPTQSQLPAFIHSYNSHSRPHHHLIPPTS